MSQIEGIRIQNLRALEDTGEITLKPITLLVGKNSVGKSTFARIFPLLRQSNEEKRRAPILWWGKFVDFGSFNEAVRRGAQRREISLGFTFNISNEPKFFWSDGIVEDHPSIDDSIPIRLDIVLTGGENDVTYVSRIVFKADDLSCSLDLDGNNRIVRIECGDIAWTPNTDLQAYSIPGELLPNIRFARFAKTTDGRQIPRRVFPLRAKVFEMIGRLAHANTSQKTISDIASNLFALSSKIDFFSRLPLVGPLTWRKAVSRLRPDDKQVTELRRWMFISAIPYLCRALNFELRNYSRGIRYLEPLRATAQRYYRTQELAVDEIDSRGENLAVFIDSMRAYERTALNRWLDEHLGFQIFPARKGGHISLTVKFGIDQAETNLADTGFGISQVLPIAIQLWSSLSQSRRDDGERATTCFVVEQPELHLHPAFQEQIADLFVATVAHMQEAKHPGFQIIAETHSPGLINRLGELVASGRIDRNDVQIVLFEQENYGSPASVRIATFDSDGILQNWPFGFFSSGRSE